MNQSPITLLQRLALGAINVHARHKVSVVHGVFSCDGRCFVAVAPFSFPCQRLLSLSLRGVKNPARSTWGYVAVNIPHGTQNIT